MTPPRAPRTVMLRLDARFAAWLKAQAERRAVSVPAFTRTLLRTTLTAKPRSHA